MPNPYHYLAKAGSRRMAAGVRERTNERRKMQRNQTALSLMQMLRIGGSMVDSYMDNEKLIEYAKQHDLEYTGNWFDRAFGGGDYKTEAGDKISRAELLGHQYYNQIQEQQNLLDKLFNPMINSKEREIDRNWTSYKYYNPSSAQIGAGPGYNPYMTQGRY